MGIVYKTFLLISIFFLSLVNFERKSGKNVLDLENLQAEDSLGIVTILKQAYALEHINGDSALALYDKALTSSRQSKNLHNSIKALTGKGSFLFNAKKENQAAKQLFSEALNLTNYITDAPAFTPILNMNIGNVYLTEGRADSAIHHYFNALEIIEKNRIKDSATLCYIYGNVGSAFLALGQWEKSLLYHKKGLTLSAQQNDSSNIAYNSFNIGCIYANMNDSGPIDSAFKYYNIALPIFLHLKQYYRLQLAYVNLGTEYIKGKDWRTAKKYLDSASSIGKKLDQLSPGLYFTYGLLAYHESNYENALPYFLKSISISEEQNVSDNKLESYRYLAESYRRLGKFKLADENEHRFSLLLDKGKNEQITRTINLLEIQFRTAEKDKELTQKKLQLASAESLLRKRNEIIIGVITCFLFTIAIFLFFFQRQRLQLQKVVLDGQKQELLQMKAVMQGEEKEKTRIGQQIHDSIMVQLSVVKMGLNSLPIKHPVLKNSADYAQLIKHLNYTSQQLRLTAHNLMPDALLTEGIIPAIQYFCKNIMTMTGLKICFQGYGPIPRFAIEAEISIYRSVQELIQNIIKHAAAQNVLVQVNYIEKTLSITVEDDGIGLDLSKTSNINKMGLESIKNRLKVLNGSMDIHESKPQGTSINLVITI